MKYVSKFGILFGKSLKYLTNLDKSNQFSLNI
jgi:hypothetical protein